MNLQHINLKLFTTPAPSLDLKTVIPVFHRWIQAQGMEELLIDVADYIHVPEGPGVMLIGHEANYSLDLSENRLGLLYNRKMVCEGSNLEKLKKAGFQLFKAAQRLTEEPELKGRLEFRTDALQLIFNDRKLIPNNSETAQAIEPEIKDWLKFFYGESQVKISRHLDPRERLTFDIQLTSIVDLQALVAK